MYLKEKKKKPQSSEESLTEFNWLKKTVQREDGSKVMKINAKL